MGEMLQGKQALVFASPFYKVEKLSGSILILLNSVIMFLFGYLFNKHFLDIHRASVFWEL